MGSIGDRGDPSVRKVKTLSEEQQKISAALAEFLQTGIGVGLPRYEGPMYEPMSPEEMRRLGWLGEAGERAQALGPSTIAAFQEALSGKPTDVEPFLASQRKLAERQFREETIPGVQEAFRGPGTYWGGARAHEVARAGEAFGEQITAREEATRLALQESARARQAGMAPAAAYMIGQATAAAIAAEEAIRTSIQQGYGMEFQEYIRTQEWYHPAIEYSLAYLGIPMTTVGFGPGDPSTLDNIQQSVGIIGSIVEIFSGGGGKQPEMIPGASTPELAVYGP